MNDYQALSLIIAAVCVFGTLLLVVVGMVCRQAWQDYKRVCGKQTIHDRYHGEPRTRNEGAAIERAYCQGCGREMRTESGMVCEDCRNANSTGKQKPEKGVSNV